MTREKMQRTIRRQRSDWLAERGVDADPAVLEHLRPFWKALGARIRMEPEITYLSALMHGLARLPLDRLPGGRDAGMIFAFLRRYPLGHAWDFLLRDWESSDEPVTARSAAWILRQVVDEKRARRRAAVTFDAVARTLRNLNAFFAVKWRPMELRSMRLDGFTAMTDGKQVNLPEKVDLPHHPELSVWGFIRLLCHEVLHLEAGTFSFDFSHGKGREIWNRLEPRRAAFAEQRARWDGDAVVRRLRADGAKLREGFKPFLPHLAAFNMHFDNPRAAHGILNLVEDIRVERILARTYPSLGEVAEILDEYELRAAPPFEFQSPEEVFFRAMLDFSRGRGIVPPIDPSYLPAWNAVRPLLDRYRTGPIGEVADSAAVALDVLDALDRHLPAPRRGSFDALIEGLAKESIEEISYRLPDLERGAGLDLHHFDRDKAEIPIGYPDDAPPELGAGRFHKYDEYDIWADRMLPGHVWLREKRWKPWERAAVLPAGRRGNALAMPARATGMRRKRGMEASGIEAHPDRAYDAVADLRAGRGSEGRIFHGNRADRQGMLAVTFVVDLSVSMQAHAPGASGPTPLMNALARINEVIPWLERSNVPTQVVGVHDYGPKPMTLYQVKDFREPYDARELARLHTVGFGGFRTGAVLRHLDRRLPMLLPRHRHLAFLFTDAGSRYVHAGASRTILKNPCRNCSYKSDCPMEPVTQKLGIRAAVDTVNIFLPAFYENADVERFRRGQSKEMAWRFVDGDFDQLRGAVIRAAGARGRAPLQEAIDEPTGKGD